MKEKLKNALKFMGKFLWGIGLGLVSGGLIVGYQSNWMDWTGILSGVILLFFAVILRGEQ